MDEEIRTYGRCIECGELITDEMYEHYCDGDGNLFCSDDCIREYFGICKIEV